MTLPSRVTQEYVDGLLPLVVASGAPSAATAPFTGDPLPGVPQSTAADVAEAASWSPAARPGPTSAGQARRLPLRRSRGDEGPDRGRAPARGRRNRSGR